VEVKVVQEEEVVWVLEKQHDCEALVEVERSGSPFAVDRQVRLSVKAAHWILGALPSSGLFLCHSLDALDLLRGVVVDMVCGNRKLRYSPILRLSVHP
jgi:hypothetical protein